MISAMQDLAKLFGKSIVHLNHDMEWYLWILFSEKRCMFWFVYYTFVPFSLKTLHINLISEAALRVHFTNISFDKNNPQ